VYIRWQIEDGYTGQPRPQAFTIDDRDLEDLSPEEIDEYVNGAIQDEFENRVGWMRLGAE